MERVRLEDEQEEQKVHQTYSNRNLQGKGKMGPTLQSQRLFRRNWAVMEWHRLAKEVMTDLERIPWQKVSVLLSDDEERLTHSKAETQKIFDELPMKNKRLGDTRKGR